MWTNILPYPVHWTASYSPQWAGLSPSRTSPCTRPQTLPAHFGWRNKNAHTHTHRLLNLWHCINLHLFPNQNSQLQNQSWRRHFNMNAKSISQKGEFFQRFWFCGTVFCFQPPGHCVFEHSVIKCWIISQSTAILISFFPTFPQNLNQTLGTKTRYDLFSPNTLMQLESDTALCLKMNKKGVRRTCE